MKISLIIGLVVGATINLAFQVSDLASVPEKQLDLIELSICASLAGLAALLPGLIHRTASIVKRMPRNNLPC